MSLPLDLDPVPQHDLDTQAQPLLASTLHQKKPFAQLHVKAAADFAVSGMSEEDVYTYGEQLVKQIRAEMNAQP